MTYRIKDLQTYRVFWMPYQSVSRARRVCRRMNRKAQEHRYEVVSEVHALAMVLPAEQKVAWLVGRALSDRCESGLSVLVLREYEENGENHDGRA